MGPNAFQVARSVMIAARWRAARTAPLRHPAGRERDPRPDHHRPGDADPVRRDRPRRLAGLGQGPALERRLPLRRHVPSSPGSGSRSASTATSPTAAFKAKPWLHGLLAILGSAAIEGPVISWVADHRKHHAFSDELGDPHSPHVDHGHGWSGALRGLFHAHMGWLFIHTQRGNKERFAPDLHQGPDHQLGRPHLHLLGDRRPAAALRARLGRSAAPSSPASPACSGAGWSGSSSSTTSPTASTRSATSSATATSRPATSRATWR